MSNYFDLLPCPFCGSSDVRAERAHSDGYHVACWGCGVRTRSVDLPDRWPVEWDEIPEDEDDYKKTIEERLCEVAVNVWNRRVKQ